MKSISVGHQPKNLASQHLATKYDFLSQFFKLAVFSTGWYVIIVDENEFGDSVDRLFRFSLDRLVSEM
ncbi:hypothetical protein NIES2130_01470 [Scytonema sp. HK-05]|nr:hypothetical protein NIES2130_01470 [Scytonema sp. HK-05]